MSFFRTANISGINNLSLKALAVLLAFLLWGQVANQETVQRTAMVPVEFLNIPDGLEISNDYAKQVEVIYRTDRPNNFDPGQLSVVIDLDRAAPETAIIHLTRANVLPTGSAEILNINPARVRLRLENTLTKVVRVESLLTGNPAKGYHVIETTAIPTEVPLSGPKSHIEKVTQVLTQPISIEGQRETLTRHVSLDQEDPKVRFEAIDHVRVSVVIEEKRKNVVLQQVRVGILPEEASARLLDRQITIRGSVPISFKGKLDAGKFRAVIDLEGIATGQSVHHLIPRVEIPEEYRKIFRIKTTAPAKIRARRTS
jgi:YbbR domain-containing protein